MLSDRCFKCHGPDAKNQKSDFRVDTRENALADLGGYFGIVPGDLEASELHLLIHSEHEDELMPPPDSNLSLSDDEKKLLDRWIMEGAPYDTHWAFKPLPAEVEVPEGNDRARTPVDHFIHRAAVENGLEPRPDAPRTSWLRRVTFDLTGLPPTLDEIDAFLADESPDAHEKVVERLLGSEAYAERMTSEWLDVARYSDSYGYQQDKDRHVWPWRDWVLESFRDNLPYDDFITWQLAGDLLPDATREQILATTFNRLHPQKVEGGSVPEEFRVEYVSDRLHTFGTAFLGLTLECSRCHDHKYDPISAKEYFEMSSFFANIDEAGLYSFFTPSVPTPTLDLSTPDQEKQLAAADEAIARAGAAVAAAREQAKPAFEAWLENPGSFEWNGLLSHISFDEPKGSQFPDLVRADKPASSGGGNVPIEGVRGKGLRLSGDDAVKLKDVGNFTRHQPFSIGLWVQTPGPLERAVIFRRSKAWTDAASRGYELLLEDGKLSAALVHFDPGNSIRVRSRDPLPVGEWHHVTLTYDGSSRASGLKLHLDGKPLATEVVRDKLTRQITGGGEPNLALGERFRDTGFRDGLVDELHVFDRELTALEVGQLPAGTPVPEALAKASREQAFEYFLSLHPPHVEALDHLEKAREARGKIQDGIPEIMVMQEMDEPRDCHLLERGAYDSRGEKVTAATPEALPPFPEDQPRNRLGLARWLTAPDHPLTARVTVNRYWQMFFGKGIVRTPEDFGSQGRPPSHPELLDWLARDFVAHDWDLHHLIRRIVLSSTYRQGTVTDARSREIDPENIYLARGSTHRLAAEMIRDQALAASGLLVEKFGGPPVRPYDSAMSFKPAKPSGGEGLYRRSVYTHWRQTAPSPVMMTLNASKREVCRVHREVTDSPLQAFVLLNGPQFVEAARVMAAKLIAKHPEAPDAVITEAFRALTTREPVPRETEILRALYDEQLAIFEAEPAKAEELLKTGAAPQAKDLPAPRQAATAVLINAIMNFDEAVSRR
ncbi:DUF1553 domain-containing protein [Verrucomicrobiaceae bacterium E54]|nr:DUF1553 domain-containing protein [Verrucomicrobiaceae bacterium E54]